MVDPAQLESLEGQDNVPELPTPTQIAAGHTAFNGSPEEQHQQHQRSPSLAHSDAPSAFGHPLVRTHSAASHVDIGRFDPQGVEQLRRTLSRQSQAHAEELRRTRTNRTVDEKKSARAPSPSPSSDESTLAGPIDGAGFDFEKALRGVIKKCVCNPVFLFRPPGCCCGRPAASIGANAEHTLTANLLSAG